MMLPSSHVTITYDVISSLLKKFEESKIIVKEVSMKKFYIKTFNSFLKQCESVQLRDPNWLFDMGGFRFPIKTKLPSTYLNSRVIRDNFKRQQVANNEVTVKASFEVHCKKYNSATKTQNGGSIAAFCDA